MSDAKELSGTIGEGSYFSDLFVQFVESNSQAVYLFGPEKLKLKQEYFSKGRPFHCQNLYEGIESARS